MKLQYNQDGATDTINLVDYQPSMHRLAIQKNGQTYYAKLGEVNHPEATDIKVRRNGKNFAVIKNYDSLRFNECGSAVSFTGTYSKINADVLNGRAIGNSSRYYTIRFPDLVLGTRDFTIDYWTYFTNENETPNPAAYCRQIALKFAYFDWRSSRDENRTTRQCFLIWAADASVRLIPDTGWLDKWFHLEYVYVHETGQIYVFFNGEQKLTCVMSQPPTNMQPLAITGERFAEIRVSDGIARHTSNFTPPTKPYEVDQYTAALLHF